MGVQNTSSGKSRELLCEAQYMAGMLGKYLMKNSQLFLNFQEVPRSSEDKSDEKFTNGRPDSKCRTQCRLTFAPTQKQTLWIAWPAEASSFSADGITS